MTIEAKQEYQWNHGFSTSLDINKVVSELQAIQKEKGEILPEFVVEVAKDKKSALHSYFVWDNKDAANKYRLQQAARLLRGIEVVVIKDGEPKTLRAFEVISKTDTISTYSSVSHIDQSKISRVIVINDLKRSINRLDPFEEYKPTIQILSTALEMLSKESTETKKELSVLQTAS